MTKKHILFTIVLIILFLLSLFFYEFNYLDIIKKYINNKDLKEIEVVHDSKPKEQQNFDTGIDSDKDGLSDYLEYLNYAIENKISTENEGKNEYEEILTFRNDPNNNVQGTVNSKNPSDKEDSDTDKDGLSDADEIKHGTSIYKIDTNDDGISDSEAISKNVDAVNNDMDEDGLSNIFEIDHGINPFAKDTDGDGLDDFDEVRKYYTDSNVKDTDGDGYIDGDEVKNGFNPNGEGALNY